MVRTAYVPVMLEPGSPAWIIPAAVTLVFQRRDGERTTTQAHVSLPADVELP